MEHQVIEGTEKEIIRLQEELGKAKLEIKTSQNGLLICDDTMKIDILGTEYKVVQGSQTTFPELADVDGYTDTSTKTIVVDDMKSIINEKGMKKNLDEHKKAELDRFSEYAFKILREYFPNLSEEQYCHLYSKITGLLEAKIFDLTTDKSWVSYRDNGRLWRDFAYICDFLKSEQETDEDSFKKISLERKNDDGQSCI